MAQLLIDAEEMEQALCTNDSEVAYYLDRRTGEIVMVVSEEIVGETDGSAERVEAEPDRYLKIDPMPSRHEFSMMERFIEQLAAPGTKDNLYRALERRHPYRAFKDALYSFPDVRRSWLAYRDRMYLDYAEEWLRREGVDAVVRHRLAG